MTTHGRTSFSSGRTPTSPVWTPLRALLRSQLPTPTGQGNRFDGRCTPSARPRLRPLQTPSPVYADPRGARHHLPLRPRTHRILTRPTRSSKRLPQLNRLRAPQYRTPHPLNPPARAPPTPPRRPTRCPFTPASHKPPPGIVHVPHPPIAPYGVPFNAALTTSPWQVTPHLPVPTFESAP